MNKILNCLIYSFHVLINFFIFVMQFFIALSCLISVSVNFSTFLVIGKTSPVTYQVLGHLKTCLVLTFGYVLLHDPFSWRNILGIFVAMIGMVSYSYYCTLQTQQKPSEASSQMSQVYGSIFIHTAIKCKNHGSSSGPWNIEHR